MYCSQCGKKVTDTMLFCPFCGSPIVIPEQDDDVQLPNPRNNVQTPVNTELAQRETFDTSWPSVEEFVPLCVENTVWEAPSTQENIFSFEETQSSVENDEGFFAQGNQNRYEESVRLEGRMPDLSAARAMQREPANRPLRREADTRVPQRRFNPDDIFMDGGDAGYEDDYEDEEEGSFFLRHIRGFVSLGLLLIVVLIVAGWACTGSGQRALAKIGLAWSPSVYAEIAYETYQTGNYSVAGNYYAKALARDRENYDYANSAGVSYYMGKNVQMATEMARKAIEIDEARLEAYQLLLRLYPNAALRSQEIQSLLLNGYRLTGDDSLNIKQ